MQDGLYISDVWVCDPVAGLTIQANDLTKPDTFQSSYSTSISLPDSVTVREITEGCEMPDAGSRKPYQYLPAYLVAGGETVFRGRFALMEYDRGWKGNLFEEKQPLFSSLDKSLREFDLSGYNFKWTIAEINARAGATSGVVFPLIDYGTLLNDNQPSDVLNPALYVHSVVDTVLASRGFRLVGALRENALYKALAMPFVEGEPTAQTGDFVEARKARVGTVSGIVGAPRSGVDVTLPLNVIDDAANGFGQGRLKLYDPASTSYVCDTDMRVKVTAFQQFQVKVEIGAVQAKLQVEKNGQVVGEAYWSEGAIYNVLGLKVESLELETTVDCKAGDRLRIRFVLERRTRVAQWEGIILFGPQHSFVGFEPDPTVKFGDTWPVTSNVPDVKALDLLRAVAFIFGGTWQVDPVRQWVELIPFDTVADNPAQEWSAYVDESEGNWTPKIDPYGQVNLLKWKETDDVPAGLFDGRIECDAQTLSAETVLFELPFAGAAESESAVGGFGAPIKVPTRTVSNSNGSVNVSKQKTAPRLVLIDAETTVDLKTSVTDTNGNVIETPVTLTACWFGKRPLPVNRPETAFSLSYNRGPLAGEADLITLHYKTLRRLLRRPRTLTVNFVLPPHIVADLDLNKPVRLRNVRFAGTTLNDGYYYINKITGYVVGRSTPVTLIAL